MLGRDEAGLRRGYSLAVAVRLSGYERRVDVEVSAKEMRDLGRLAKAQRGEDEEMFENVLRAMRLFATNPQTAMAARRRYAATAFVDWRLGA